nr:hypothetical protein [Akkermansiaceae bacterium]
VKKSKGPTARALDIPTPAWEIIDSAKLQNALDLIHNTANKSRLGSDGNGILSQQIELLPERHDFMSQMYRIAYVAASTSYSIRFRKLADALAAGAQQCAATRDVEGFQRIKGDWEKISLTLTREGTTMVDLLVAKVFLFATVENFRDAAKTLGLEEDFKRFDQLHELKKADRARKTVKGRRDPIQDLIRMRGSILATLSLPLLPNQTTSRVELTESDLRPSRYTDHALVSRAFSIIALLPLGIAALLAWMHQFRQSPILRGLSQRMVDQLRGADWIWIFVGGVLLPFLGYMGFVHFTSMSSREWSFKHTGFVHIYAEFLALLVMMLVLSPVIAAWRLNKRCKVFQLKSPRMWMGVVAAVGAMLAIPTAGWILSMPNFTNAMVYAASVLLILPILWLLGGCLVTLMDHRDEALRRGVLARVMVPVWIFAMVVMALSVPLHYRIEKQWVQQDRLFEIRPEAPAMSTYEWDVTQALRAELLELQR